jgi:hypothetical protein
VLVGRGLGGGGGAPPGPVAEVARDPCRQLPQGDQVARGP